MTLNYIKRPSGTDCCLLSAKEIVIITIHYASIQIWDIYLQNIIFGLVVPKIFGKVLDLNELDQRGSGPPSFWLTKTLFSAVKATIEYQNQISE